MQTTHAPTFENTVSILVKAYLNDTLQKGNCCACAVGNICANSIGTTVIPVPLTEAVADMGFSKDFDWAEGIPKWQTAFYTHDGVQTKEGGFLANAGIRQAEFTGYTVEQLARVEFAFETAAEGLGEEAEFAGLMAVVDVLADIHRVDLTTTTAAKALFVKA